MTRFPARTLVPRSLRYGVIALITSVAMTGLTALVPVSQASAAPVSGRPWPSGGLVATAGRIGGTAGRGPARATGTVSGLLESITGGPFGQACVTAAGPDGRVSVTSHRDGRFLIADLRPGRYAFSVGACAGGIPLSSAWPGQRSLVLVRAGTLSRLAAVRVWPTRMLTAAAGPAAPAVRTGSISGQVTAGGRPVRAICAVALPTTYFAGGSHPDAVTSARGRYRISDLPAGRYDVLFRTGLRSCPSAGNWLPQWYPERNSPYPSLNVVAVRVRPGKDTGHIDGRLRAGGELSGLTRTAAGHPVRGICVSFSSSYIVNGSYSVEAGATSGPGGRYALHGLFPGRYDVQFELGCGATRNYAQQWWRDQPTPAHANPVRITGARRVSGIDATLKAGGAITGAVRSKTSPGRPIAGLCVYASDPGGDFAQALTGKNGRYRVEGLDSGRYQLSFDPSCNGSRAAYYLAAHRSVLVVGGRTRTGLDVALSPASGISGVIRDPAGRPVAGTCVTVGDSGRDYDFADPDGHYEITGVPPGRYTVYFETDCDEYGSLAPQWYPDRPDADSAAPLTFPAGRIDRISITLHPGGTVAGVLRTPAGQPVPNECVAVLAQSDEYDYGFTTETTTTDDAGRYAITDLSPGQYQITFNCLTGKYADQWFDSQPDSTTAEYLAIPGGVTTRVSPRISLGGQITGVVTAAAGRPIHSICVNVADAKDGRPLAPPFVGRVTTFHGRYLIGQLTPGRYLIQFSDCNAGKYGTQWFHRTGGAGFATPVTVRAGRTTSGIDSELTVGGTISGRVSGPGGAPKGGVCAYAFDPATDAYSDLSFTAADGRYTIRGLATGSYQLSFTACVLPAPKSSLASVTLPKPVRVVAPGHRSGVNVTLKAGASISGSVSGDASTPGPQTGACVVAVPVDSAGVGQFAWTDASGRYELSGLAAGSYRVYLDDPFCPDGESGIADLAPQWYDGRPVRGQADLVKVRAGQVAGGISAVLRPAAAVEGKVSSAAGPVAGECVTAVPVGQPADPWTGEPAARVVAITSQQGRYRLFDVLPGRYKIEFSGGCGGPGYATQWWQDAGSARSAQVIRVGNTTISPVSAVLRH